eukprot:3931394-Pyramimonas_sp.AAC.1
MRRVRHVGPATGAFDGAPCGAMKRVRDVPNRVRVQTVVEGVRICGVDPVVGAVILDVVEISKKLFSEM